MDRNNPQTQTLIEETIRLGFLVAALVLVYKWQWVEHQIWKLTTLRDRGRNQARMAEIQVGKEISMMEHGQHEDPLAFQQP